VRRRDEALRVIPPEAFRIFDGYVRETVDQYAYLAEAAEIEENDFNLNIPRYMDTFEPEPPIDMRAVNREIRDLKTQLADVEARMAHYLKELGRDD
jgi:type I restriction enzyme M protein